MASTVTVDNLVEGQEIVLPYEVTGSAAGDSGARLVGIARQVDNNPLVDIGENCVPVVPDPSGGASNPTSVTFAFELTLADCPQVGGFFILTIHVWDDAGDCTHTPVTFQVTDLRKEVVHAP
jgi:hypothetical protein